jgi:hypothetical protein
VEDERNGLPFQRVKYINILELSKRNSLDFRKIKRNKHLRRKINKHIPNAMSLRNLLRQVDQ